MQAAETAIAVFLFINSIYDIKRREIILFGTVVMAVLGFAASFIMFERDIYDIVCGIIPGVMLLLCAAASNGKLGLGDAIIMMAVGVWQGLIRTAYILLVALFAAVFFGLCLIIVNRKQKDIPFIPFIFIGQLMTWLF